MTTQEILEAARTARSALALADGQTRTQALWGMADWLCHPDQMDAILAANAEDMAAAKGHISDVMLDRLALTPERIGAMARGILDVAALPDPVGAVLNRIQRPNGLRIEKTAVPMGVIAIIYESRPNVTSDAAALAIKSGNACVLRCGKEAWRSAHAIVEALRKGLQENGLPEAAVSLIEDTTHASANALMTAVGYVDLLIPRGGAGLIRACVENAKVPCIQTGTGICHIFVDDSADQDKALNIIENAKASRPSVCNAEEVCLVHSAIAAEFLPKLAKRLGEERTAKGLHPVELRLDQRFGPVHRGDAEQRLAEQLGQGEFIPAVVGQEGHIHLPSAQPLLHVVVSTLIDLDLDLGELGGKALEDIRQQPGTDGVEHAQLDLALLQTVQPRDALLQRLVAVQDGADGRVDGRAVAGHGDAVFAAVE